MSSFEECAAVLKVRCAVIEIIAYFVTISWSSMLPRGGHRGSIWGFDGFITADEASAAESWEFLLPVAEDGTLYQSNKFNEVRRRRWFKLNISNLERPTHFVAEIFAWFDDDGKLESPREMRPISEASSRLEAGADLVQGDPLWRL